MHRKLFKIQSVMPCIRFLCICASTSETYYEAYILQVIQTDEICLIFHVVLGFKVNEYRLSLCGI